MFRDKAIKALALVTLFAMLASSLLGCGATPEPTKPPEPTKAVAQPTDAPEPVSYTHLRAHET